MLLRQSFTSIAFPAQHGYRVPLHVLVGCRFFSSGYGYGDLPVTTMEVHEYVHTEKEEKMLKAMTPTDMAS